MTRQVQGRDLPQTGIHGNARRLPTNMYLGEVSGVSVDSKDHIFRAVARQHP
jgi:hypothetical protein